MTPDHDTALALVRAHVNQLAEHFDSVQIFVTRHEAGEHDGTINVNLGAGNWFSRLGQVTYWLKKEDRIAQMDAEAEQ